MPPSTFVGFENRIPNSKKYPIKEKTKRDTWKRFWTRESFSFLKENNKNILIIK